MTIIVTDRGKSYEVSDVDRWVEERKALLRQGRDLVKGYDGNPRLLYPHYGTLVTIVRRLAEIKVIFDTYNRERNRHRRQHHRDSRAPHRSQGAGGHR